MLSMALGIGTWGIYSRVEIEINCEYGRLLWWMASPSEAPLPQYIYTMFRSSFFLIPPTSKRFAPGVISTRGGQKVTWDEVGGKK